MTQENATERAGTGEYLGNKEPGIYVDIVSGEPLFASPDKYDSGWLAQLHQAHRAGSCERTARHAHGMVRTEVRSTRGDNHLGHVFPDGPADRGGLRYCINSASLRFIHRGRVPSCEWNDCGMSEAMAFQDGEGPSGSDQRQLRKSEIILDRLALNLEPQEIR